MDRYMSERMNEWINSCINDYINEWMHQLMKYNGSANERTKKVEPIDRFINERTKNKKTGYLNRSAIASGSNPASPAPATPPRLTSTWTERNKTCVTVIIFPIGLPLCCRNRPKKCGKLLYGSSPSILRKGKKDDARALPPSATLCLLSRIHYNALISTTPFHSECGCRGSKLVLSDQKVRRKQFRFTPMSKTGDWIRTRK